MPSVAAASDRHEDWSEIEALLAAPNAAVEAVAAPVAARTTPARRLSLGLATVLVFGGVAASGLAPMRSCRGDACGSPTNSRALAATSAATPVRVVSIDVAPTAPDVGRDLAEGRSEAEPTPVRRGPQTARRPRRSPPTPPTAGIPPVTPHAPRSSRAKPPLVRRPAIAAADHAPRSVLAGARPTALAARQPTARTWTRGPARLRLVWISPTRYVLVEKN